MSDTPAVCAACGGSCEEGWLLNLSPFGGYTPGRWVKGPPARDSSGSVLFAPGWPQTEIQVFRCVECGRLELFVRRSGERPK